MAKFEKGTTESAREKVKGINLEDWHRMTGEWMPEVAKVTKEGIEATDKDGNPDWNARYRFIALVLAYNFGRPKESVKMDVEEDFRQIIIGNLKDE